MSGRYGTNLRLSKPKEFYLVVLDNNVYLRRSREKAIGQASKSGGQVFLVKPKACIFNSKYSWK